MIFVETNIYNRIYFLIKMPIIDDVSYHDSSLKCCLHINKATELHGNLGKDHWSSPSHVLCTTYPKAASLKLRLSDTEQRSYFGEQVLAKNLWGVLTQQTFLQVPKGFSYTATKRQRADPEQVQCMSAWSAWEPWRGRGEFALCAAELFFSSQLKQKVI